jgi:hypothetical protein
VSEIAFVFIHKHKTLCSLASVQVKVCALIKKFTSINRLRLHLFILVKSTHIAFRSRLLTYNLLLVSSGIAGVISERFHSNKSVCYPCVLFSCCLSHCHNIDNIPKWSIRMVYQSAWLNTCWQFQQQIKFVYLA